jgi:hypothetical protein
MERREQIIHQAVADHLRLRGKPGVVWWHTNNNIGGRGRKFYIQGAIAKSLGVRAGVSDIVALYQGRFHALELKSSDGRPSAVQLAFIADVQAAGGFACVAHGIDEALRALEGWKLLRGRTA